jgi:hypothetical protein
LMMLRRQPMVVSQAKLEANQKLFADNRGPLADYSHIALGDFSNRRVSDSEDDSTEGERLRRYELANGRAKARSLNELDRRRLFSSPVVSGPLSVAYCEAETVSEAIAPNEPTEAQKNAPNEPTDGCENATNEPTDGCENVTNEPTDGCENVTNEPTDGCENVTNEPTDGCENVTNEPTDGCENVTNEPTDGCENVTNEPTEAQRNAPNEPTDACENVTNEPKLAAVGEVSDGELSASIHGRVAAVFIRLAHG